VTTNDELGHLATQFNAVHQRLYTANLALQSKIQSADEKLVETNKRLQQQSEELIKMNEEFRQLAITDPLTGLFNRRYFEKTMKDELAMSLRHSDKHCVLLIDIDFFKNINDTYGHLEGDRVLQHFAMSLKEQARGTDILCRMGGEEFVVMCRRINKEDAIVMADKFRRNIEKIVFRFGTDIVRITVSIGLTVFPENPDDTIDEILNQADEALYYCKRNGRNRVALYEYLPKTGSETLEPEPASNVKKFPGIVSGDKK
jgi:diguanylate cyclase (GGDEF)-like protein